MAEQVLEALRICRGLGDADRADMAAIYWEAFGRKLKPLLGKRDRVLRVLERDLRPSAAFGAYRAGELVGIAGVTVDEERLLDPHTATYVDEYGWLKGRVLAGMMRYVYRMPYEGEVYLSALAVKPEARGQGVGTALLNEVLAYAQELGKSTIGLEVIDTNPGARRLYERMGFVVIKRQRMPYARMWGFTGLDVMIRRMA
ncbi:MAG: GNAT family N-acetyltransferase [Anaerolineae bacterium]